jgi:TolB-like protein/tetratricopeptide (TPR) repeat protein
MAVSELLELVSSALAGRYRVSHTVGTGGMGVVFHAVDLRHERPVAIKILKPELAFPHWSTRFLREIQIASKLQHPNILALYDSGEVLAEHPEPFDSTQGRLREGPRTLLYYVMPFVAGESLRARLKREGKLPLTEAVRLVREVAEGLGHAHELGVVHRDIKPENILLSSGHALVCDFGIARALTLAATDSPTTEPGLAFGTPAYMSPEQFISTTDLDGRTDIYSLGCVLFELLAGTPPFQGPSGVSFLMQHSTAHPPSLRRFRSDVPASLENTINRALAKAPDERFRTAAELITALDLSADSPRHAEPLQTGMVVAVLPFANLSGDPATEYLSDGISEELMQALAEIEGLRLVGRTSAFAFKGKREDVRDIAERLRADVIVDGSVRVEGDRVRISAQLVNAADGYQLWSGRYQRPAGDTFVIEDDIANTIAGVLRQRLSPGHEITSAPTPVPTPPARRDPVAHEAYLKGRYHWNKRTEEEIARAIVWFERAIARAVEDAASHAALADAHLTLSIYGARPAQSAMAKARAAAKQALALDSRSAEAHAALGSVDALFEWAWRRAEEHFRLALELKPGYPTAHQWQAMHVLAPLGRLGDARHALEHARELDPLSPAILTSLAVLSLFERQWDRAVRELLEVIDLEPGFATAYYFLGQALLWRGESAEAEAELARAASLAGRSVETLAGLAYAQGVSGHRAEATAVLDELTLRAGQSYVSPVRIAQIHLGLGERDQALAWLGQAVEQHCTEVAWFGVHPMFDELRSEPAFVALLERTGLAQTESSVTTAASPRPVPRSAARP